MSVDAHFRLVWRRPGHPSPPPPHVGRVRNPSGHRETGRPGRDRLAACTRWTLGPCRPYVSPRGMDGTGRASLPTTGSCFARGDFRSAGNENRQENTSHYSYPAQRPWRRAHHRDPAPPRPRPASRPGNSGACGVQQLAGLRGLCQLRARAHATHEIGGRARQGCQRERRIRVNGLATASPPIAACLGVTRPRRWRHLPAPACIS